MKNIVTIAKLKSALIFSWEVHHSSVLKLKWLITGKAWYTSHPHTEKVIILLRPWNFNKMFNLSTIHGDHYNSWHQISSSSRLLRIVILDARENVLNSWQRCSFFMFALFSHPIFAINLLTILNIFLT